MSEQVEKETAWKAPSILLGGGHLAALWALAVVQPLLSLLGSNPDFFVARDNTGGQIVLFALIVTFGPPLVATGIEALLALINGKARWAFHLVLVALLFALLVIQVFKQVADGPATPMIVVAVLAGIALAWFYGYGKFLRSLTDILIPAPVIILAVFLFFSDASELTTSSNEVEAAEVSIGNPAPVVMLVFDEFPVGSLMTPGHDVNAKRFPHFAELQEKANWYRNTVTDASYTAIAVPSILTGKSADRDSLPTAADHPDSIFTLLGGSYDVHGVEPITHLCPPSLCEEQEEDKAGTTEAVSDLFTDLKYVSAHLNLPEDMSASLPDISQSFQGFDNGAPSESIERGRARQFVRNQLDTRDVDSTFNAEGDVDVMLTNRAAAPDRTLDFAHVEEPHYPWTHYPDGLRYSESSEDFRGFISETEWLDDGYPTDRARQAHLLEVGFADYLLGRVMDRVKTDGLWDETLFVVVADHGGAMTRGIHRREANPETMGQIAMVPFFVKAPGQKRGRVIDRVQCVTDILPAIAQRLEIDVPWESPECNRKEVELDNGSGPTVTLPMDEVLEQRDAYIAVLSDLFGGNTGYDDVLKLGPNKDLIGTGSLNIAPPEDGSSGSPEVSGDLVTNLQPNIPLNPVLRQRGVLTGVDEGTPLAVSVNGEIAAVGQAYRDHSRTLYSILLPRKSLRPGPNDIRLLRVDRDAGGTKLTELWSSAG
ncbi:MAG: sulfatase-like hydrolase/transferase [Solirubrobacterales bacterium]